MYGLSNHAVQKINRMLCLINEARTERRASGRPDPSNPHEWKYSERYYRLRDELAAAVSACTSAELGAWIAIHGSRAKYRAYNAAGEEGRGFYPACRDCAQEQGEAIEFETKAAACEACGAELEYK